MVVGFWQERKIQIEVIGDSPRAVRARLAAVVPRLEGSAQTVAGIRVRP